MVYMIERDLIGIIKALEGKDWLEKGFEKEI